MFYGGIRLFKVASLIFDFAKIKAFYTLIESNYGWGLVWLNLVTLVLKEVLIAVRFVQSLVLMKFWYFSLYWIWSGAVTFGWVFVNFVQNFSVKSSDHRLTGKSRSSCLQMFFKIGVPKYFAIFTGKYLYWSLSEPSALQLY